MKQRVHWLTLHRLVRALAWLGARRGDPQARMIADPAVAADPVSFCDELRPLGPLIRCRVAYLAVGHAVAQDVLRSDDFRVLSLGANLPGPIRWLERRTRDALPHPLLPPSLLAVEPPDHTRYRKSVSSVFTPRAVAALRDRVEETADALLTELDGESGVIDIVDRYCSQLPVAVISDILGVPARDRGRILAFGELAAASLDIGLTWPQYRRVHQAIADFNAWLTQHLRKLRRTPGDDLLSQLIQSADSGSPESYLDESELQGIAGLVLIAGFETTVNLLGNGIHMLMTAPDQLQTLQQRPHLWPNAVEEILRLESPVQLTARAALRGTEIAGTRIAAGEMVVAYLAAANRDPAVFADPHRFDIQRANAGRHLSFSGGRHFCLGAALARAEGEVGLRTFFDRFPGARPAAAGARRDTRVLHGWSALPVALGPARSLATR